MLQRLVRTDGNLNRILADPEERCGNAWDHIIRPMSVDPSQAAESPCNLSSPLTEVRYRMLIYDGGECQPPLSSTTIRGLCLINRADRLPVSPDCPDVSTQNLSHKPFISPSRSPPSHGGALAPIRHWNSSTEKAE